MEIYINVFINLVFLERTDRKSNRYVYIIYIPFVCGSNFLDICYVRGINDLHSVLEIQISLNK